MQAKTKKTGNGVLAVVGNLASQETTTLKRVIGHASTEDLKAEVARLLGFSADNLIRLALITQELESRGEDLSSIRFGLLPLLRQIACGKLAPQIVVMYAGHPGALRKIAGMPLKDQEAIVNGEKKFILYDPADYKPRGGKAKSEPINRFKTPEYAGSKCPGDEASDTSAAVWHANELCRLLQIGKVMSMDGSVAAFNKLAKMLGERDGRIPIGDLRRAAGAFLSKHGRCALTKMAKEMPAIQEDLVSALDHLWFAKDGSTYCLSLTGRKAIDD